MNGVYDRIRQLRIANGLTQDELALAVGYKGRSMMSQVELGKVELLFPASPPEKVAAAITVAVKLDGMDEALDKAHELVRTIEKTKSLVGDLAVDTQRR